MSDLRQPPKQVPRILLLDQSEHDIALTLLVLRQAFPDASVTTASNALTFGEAFERGGYDVIITEQTLGWSDGIKVLKAAKGLCEELEVKVAMENHARDRRIRALKVNSSIYAEGFYRACGYRVTSRGETTYTSYSHVSIPIISLEKSLREYFR